MSDALYINGSIAGTSTEARQTPTQPLDFGGQRSDFGQNFYWNGLIDEVHIFNRVLTPAEILGLATIDTTPPTVTITSVTPDTLWPPNGKLVPVTITGTITDAGSGVNMSTTAYAVIDEYGLIQPSGSVTVNADGSYAFTIPLQASRKGNDKDGRQYTIIISAQDEVGNIGSATTQVIVPHDQGGL